MATVFRSMPAMTGPIVRRHFCAGTAQDSAIIYATTKEKYYPQASQVLSLRAPQHGTESYFLNNRVLTVSPNDYLILNHGQSYASRTTKRGDTGVFRVFFNPGFVRETHFAIQTPIEDTLDEHTPSSDALIEFPTHLRRNDKLVTPLVRSLVSMLATNRLDSYAREELLVKLVAAVVALRKRVAQECGTLSAVKACTRRELYRRIRLATDALLVEYSKHWTLDELCRISCLSKYHFLRSFKAVEGTTPRAYLRRKRVEVASHLLKTTGRPVSEICQAVGFEDRSTLFRAFQDHCQLSPSQVRKNAC